ncbi:MAG: hypothetical protein JXA66_00500 [Oligoflexia bacterium]|nr:hypothetical protein [Oligoflexia bacterium]
MPALAFTACASTKIQVEDIYFKDPGRERLIQSSEYHNEVIATKDISKICSDIILNNAGPSENIQVELLPLDDGRIRLLNITYSRQDIEIALCIEEVLQKYEFPAFGIVNFRKKYEDGTYYSFSKVFKCKTKHTGEKFTYVFEPYSSDELRQTMPLWDGFIITLTSWTLGCR